MSMGIYKIENQVNGHIYIGQSVNIQKRWNAHRECAFRETSHSYNYPLSRAFRKYGIENFSFEIQEECERTQLDDRERYYIQKFDSFFHGYNQTMGGGSGSGGTPKEHVIGIIHDLETTNMFHKEIAKKWGVSTEIVQGINTGRYWKYDRIYPIQNRYIYIERKGWECNVGKMWFCIDCGKPVWKKSKRCRECDNKRRITIKPVSRSELKELIRSVSFVEIGRKYNVTSKAIQNWCKAYGLPFRKKEINMINDLDWQDV